MTCRAAVFAKAHGKLEVITHPIPEPAHGQVQIKVLACVICHGDHLVEHGAFPGITYPRAPGHELVGTVSKLGEGVTTWQVGQVVGVGWNGYFCGLCDSCRQGKFVLCPKSKVTGIHSDGGYSEYMVAPSQCVAAIPDGLTPEEAAPLLCAGLTVFNSLRNTGTQPGEVVAVQGIGGLGHLGIQYSKKMGYYTVAISTSADKKELAHKLGADLYIDTSKEDAAQVLQKLGGAKVVLSTVFDAKAMSSMVPCLGNDGILLVIGTSTENLSIPVLPLIMKRISIKGWGSGTAPDSEDTLKFSKLSGIVPMIQVFPIEKAQDAYDLAMSNKARFRVVLKHNHAH